MNIKLKKLKHENVIITYYYEVDKLNQIYRATIKNYEEDKIIFTSKNKKNLIKKLKEFIKKEKYNVKKLYEEENEILYSISNFIKNYKNEKIAYHISKTSNEKNILEKGLIPSYNKEESVFEENLYFDNINKNNIKKSECLYFHPNLEENFFIGENYKNCSVFAVNLEGEKGIIGSIGLSGEILCEYERIKENSNNGYNVFEEYYKNSIRLENYNSFRRKKLDKRWGLDEILIDNKIESNKIELIGRYDSNGYFIYNENLFKYLKIDKEEFLKMNN